MIAFNYLFFLDVTTPGWGVGVVTSSNNEVGSPNEGGALMRGYKP